MRKAQPRNAGSPQSSPASRVVFLTRHVVTSRTICGGRFMDRLVGGLNRQVEAQLFPEMARPKLHRANALIHQACERNGIVFTETGLIQSYALVVRYLSQVGLSAADPLNARWCARSADKPRGHGYRTGLPDGC